MRRAPRGPGSGADCTDGFRARVSGHLIERVVFRMNGGRIASLTNSPYQVFIRAAPGVHRITARVTFEDSTRARTLRFRYRACAAQARQPRRGPSQFTG